MLGLKSKGNCSSFSNTYGIEVRNIFGQFKVLWPPSFLRTIVVSLGAMKYVAGKVNVAVIDVNAKQEVIIRKLTRDVIVKNALYVFNVKTMKYLCQRLQQYKTFI